jgi:hypothetical protein
MASSATYDASHLDNLKIFLTPIQHSPCEWSCFCSTIMRMTSNNAKSYSCHLYLNEKSSIPTEELFNQVRGDITFTPISQNIITRINFLVS